jgi:hypothetical protein
MSRTGGPYEDPTEGMEVGSAPNEDPTRGA